MGGECKGGDEQVERGRRRGARATAERPRIPLSRELVREIDISNNLSNVLDAVLRERRRGGCAVDR